MDILFTELILWGGLLFLFWAIKDHLGKVETDLQMLQRKKNNFVPPTSCLSQYVIPEEVTEAMGSYLDATIYRYVTIARERYIFDHIQLADEDLLLENERSVAPGLIYVRC